MLYLQFSYVVQLSKGHVYSSVNVQNNTFYAAVILIILQRSWFEESLKCAGALAKAIGYAKLLCLNQTLNDVIQSYSTE